MTSRYQEPRAISRADAEKAFASGSREEVTDALVGITFHDPDHEWVEQQCLRLARHPDPVVRQLAATCLGHLARFHRKLDLDRVLPVLDELLNDPEVAGCAQDALGDIRMFILDK